MTNNPTQITLEFAKKLRKQRKPEIIIDPSIAIPHEAITWFIYQLEIESAVMYIYQSTGRAALNRKIYGNRDIWKNLDIELEKTNSDESKILIEITCLQRGKHHDSEPIGYLGFFRKDSFTDEEKIALVDITSFFGDYMYEIFELNRLQLAKYAIDKISKSYIINKKPGSYLRTCLGTVTRAMRAYSAYYATILDKKLIIEYYQKPKWDRPKFPYTFPQYDIPDTFSQLCYKNDFFQWVDLNKKSTLTEILENYSNNGKRDFEYLVGVSKVDKQPISVWIFQFTSKQIVFFDINKELITNVLSIAKNSVKYLFQRRSNKMIVDPIFKSNDTRIDERLLFTIMPFTEKWSDRIWDKILKPIALDEGMNPIRANDLYGRDIMEDIWQSILKSKIIIADITGRNPNVFYELGIAHTLGKEVILLTQRVEDIPFDLNRYRHIIYEDNYDGYEKLKNELKATIRDIIIIPNPSVV